MTTIRRRKTGFFIADSAVFERKSLSANEKLVYLYLCRRADSENKAWPSYQRITDDCGLSRRTVIEMIKKLINKSLLKKNSGVDGFHVFVYSGLCGSIADCDIRR